MLEKAKIYLCVFVFVKAKSIFIDFDDILFFALVIY